MLRVLAVVLLVVAAQAVPRKHHHVKDAENVESADSSPQQAQQAPAEPEGPSMLGGIENEISNMIWADEDGPRGDEARQAAAAQVEDDDENPTQPIMGTATEYYNDAKDLAWSLEERGKEVVSDLVSGGGTRAMRAVGSVLGDDNEAEDEPFRPDLVAASAHKNVVAHAKKTAPSHKRNAKAIHRHSQRTPHHFDSPGRPIMLTGDPEDEHMGERVKNAGHDVNMRRRPHQFVSGKLDKPEEDKSSYATTD